MEIDEYLPTLESNLELPSVAYGLEASTIVWRALGKAPAPLTPESFIKVLNRELSAILSVKEQEYVLLTEISLNCLDLPKSSKREDAEIKFWPHDFPIRYRQSRTKLLYENGVSIKPTPEAYCKVTVSVRAKSPGSAFHKAMRALDIQRALWCLMTNSVMQITFGGGIEKPVNGIRLGSKHTLHTTAGQEAFESIWYEPNFKETSVFRLKKPRVFLKNSKFAIRRISSCAYGERLSSSLIRYVRALDESDANTTFLRLWGAMEALATPGIANYDNVVKRCSFLYAESAYHRQVLEQLREYRNASVHAGEESSKARTHCFQMQRYYRDLFWFHIRNAIFFRQHSRSKLLFGFSGKFR